MTHALRPRVDDPRLKRPPRFAARRLTASARALPDFLVIGAMKSGTSSLFDYLCRHPSVASPWRKETHFFDLAWARGRGLGWYRAHFPLRARMPDGARVGEATPQYLFDPAVPARIASLAPVKLIAVLRDPVERAISHYRHEVRMGREYLPIQDAMRLEERRLEEACVPDRMDTETYAHASYKKRGLYLEQLERYWRLFPASDILVLSSKDLSERPAETVERAFGFLGLPDRRVDHRFTRKNEAPTKAAVPASVREELAGYFEEPNRRLFEALGRDALW